MAGRPRGRRRARSCRAPASRCRRRASRCPDDVPAETYAASDWNLRPEHPHWPLVWLTLLSQLAVGVERHRRRRRRTRPSPPASPAPALVGALFHLGRPAVAWKALRNLRRSWLSREVALLGAVRRAGGRRPSSLPALAVAAVVAGAAGVYASARLYVVPGRPAWDTPLTIVRFFATAVALGPAAHRPRRASPPPASRVALGRDGAQLVAPRRATRASRGAARCASSCAGSGPWTVLRWRRWRRAASPAPSPAGRLAVVLGARRRQRADRALAVLRHRRAAEHARVRSGGAPRGATGDGVRPRPTPGSAGCSALDHGGDRYTLRRRARPRAGERQPRRRPLGAHDVRLLLGRLRDAARRARRPGRRRAGRPRPPGQPRAAVPEGPVASTTRSPPTAGSPTPLVDGRPATWDDALDRVVDGFRDLLDATRPGVGRRAVDRPARDRGVLRARQARAPRHGPAPLRRQHDAVHGQRGVRLQAQLRQPTARPAATRTSSWPTSSCCGAPTSPTTTRCSRRACSAGGISTVIVVDPRVTKTAMVADVHLAVRPRGDIALLNGIMRVLLDEGLVDLDARAPATSTGSTSSSPTSPRGPSSGRPTESGIDADDAAATTARTIGRAERCVLAWTMGVNHSVQGTETVTLLNTLALLTGNIGRPGRGAVLDHRAVQRDGHPRDRASRRRCPATAPTTTRPPGPSWPRCGASTRTGCPTERGRAYPDIVNAVVAGTIKGLWVIGTNPVVSFPNREILELALGSLDLLVVQDGFETPTTALADVVLPAAIWGEKDGTFTNSERRVSRVRAAVRSARARRAPTSTSSSPSPSGGAVRDELFAGWTDAAATPSRSGGACRPGGRATTAASPGSASTQPAACSGRARPATRRCRSAGRRACTPTCRFHRPGGKAAVRAVEPEPIRDPPTTRATRCCSTPAAPSSTGTPARRPAASPILEGLAPEAWVEVHPDDAAAARRRARATGRGSSSQRGEHRADPGPRHGDRPARRGVRPVPLGRALRQPADRRRVRPDQPRAELQAVRRARRAGGGALICADPAALRPPTRVPPPMRVPPAGWPGARTRVRRRRRRRLGRRPALAASAVASIEAALDDGRDGVAAGHAVAAEGRVAERAHERRRVGRRADRLGCRQLGDVVPQVGARGAAPVGAPVGPVPRPAHWCTVESGDAPATSELDGHQ